MEPYFDLVGFAAVATSDFPGSEVYGLADHGGMPGLDKQLARAGIAWRTLFEGSHEEGAAAVAPLLFSLSEAWADGHRRLLEWVAEHGTYTSSLLLLATPLPIDEVAARLACRLDAMLSEEMNVLLRFFRSARLRGAAGRSGRTAEGGIPRRRRRLVVLRSAGSTRSAALALCRVRRTHCAITADRHAGIRFARRKRTGSGGRTVGRARSGTVAQGVASAARRFPGAAHRRCTADRLDFHA